MKSILFKKPMYEAVRHCIKTQTRRIVKWDKPKYNEGDIVYVKEPILLIPGVSQPHYLHDGNPDGLDLGKCRKLSPLFMPEKYARVYLTITGVKKQRLQDITDNDCILEGIKYKIYEPWYWMNYQTGKYDELSPKDSFRSLWDSIATEEFKWEKNPEVWVYSFINTSIKQLLQ